MACIEMTAADGDGKDAALALAPIPDPVTVSRAVSSSSAPAKSGCSLRPSLVVMRKLERCMAV